jgi:hypothetical protein
MRLDEEQIEHIAGVLYRFGDEHAMEIDDTEPVHHAVSV